MSERYSGNAQVSSRYSGNAGDSAPALPEYRDERAVEARREQCKQGAAGPRPREGEGHDAGAVVKILSKDSSAASLSGGGNGAAATSREGTRPHRARRALLVRRKDPSGEPFTPVDGVAPRPRRLEWRRGTAPIPKVIHKIFLRTGRAGYDIRRARPVRRKILWIGELEGGRAGYDIRREEPR